MKGTDDGKTIDGQDAGAIPAASTKHQVSYQGIFDFSKALNAYYYTPSEWSRSIGWGTVPDEKEQFIGGETGSTDGRKLARGLGHKNIKANDDFYFNEYALAA